jgi:ATP-binding cassette subfamily B protein
MNNGMIKQLLRINYFLRPYIKQVIANLLLLLGISFISLIIPQIIKRVIDEGISSGNTAAIGRYALILFSVGAVGALLSLFQRYLAQWIGARVGYDLRNALYDRIQNLPFSFHDHTQTGQLISRCIEDVRSIQEFSGSSIIEWAQLLIFGVGITTMMFLDNLTLGIIALLPLIPLVFLAFDFGNRITRLFYKVDSALGALSTTLQENVTGAQVVRAFAREEFEIKRFDNSNRDYFNARMEVISNWGKLFPTGQWLVTLSTILLLWFGGQQVLRGELTIGTLVAFNALLLLLAAPVQQLTWLVNASGEAAAGAQRVWEILDLVPEIRSPNNAASAKDLRGEIEFRDVSLVYKYETSDSLHNIDLKVTENQVVALIGSTGSGKTSLINLIPRFYDVSKGEVLIDGVNVKEYDLVDLRRKIGMVLQTSLLFSDSVFENIRFGRPSATDHEVIEAAKFAQAHEFIMDLPEGYQTVVGERGITLSGGQRQRVAIARALLINPRILILDDSLSSVDTNTEKLIQNALNNLMVGRTTIIIAHRISSVKKADSIVVLDKGTIVEVGTHKQLIQRNGLYREIFNMQLEKSPSIQGESTPAADVDIFRPEKNDLDEGTSE